MVIQCKNLISLYILPDQGRVNLLVFYIQAVFGGRKLKDCKKENLFPTLTLWQYGNRT